MIRVVQLKDVIKRLLCPFLNPTRAGLVATIDDYPGVATWEAFKTGEPSVDAQVDSVGTSSRGEKGKKIGECVLP